jgi:hypothetical protein
MAPVICTDCTGKSNYHTITTTTDTSYDIYNIKQERRMEKLLIVEWINVNNRNIVRGNSKNH